MYRRFGKRVFDLSVSIALLPLVLPVGLLVSLLIRVSLGRPVLFRHERPGLGGRTFTLYKFRTMTNESAADGTLLNDEQRLTTVGRFLRMSSLDELPELWNVLRGDMSLVGPRPLLVRYLGRYSPHQSRRHEVRPGITGLAQVSGRNSLTWGEKFDIDVEYVDNLSFVRDLRILIKTVVVTLRRDGISAEGSATAHEFCE